MCVGDICCDKYNVIIELLSLNTLTLASRWLTKNQKLVAKRYQCEVLRNLCFVCFVVVLHK
jgi:hypothetical protein